MVDWLNCIGNLYVTYTNTPDPIMVQLIEKYGFIFDDDYWYWIPKQRKGNGKRLGIVKRAPIWTYPVKSVPSEKAHYRVKVPIDQW